MRRTLLIFGIATTLASCQSKQGNSEIDEPEDYRELKENTIINLYDAFGENRDGLKKDFGFSCIVKFNGQTILFDGGTNADLFRQNVEALNINLSEVDFAVASHPHFDHINGFDYLLEVNPDVKIYFPFDLFWGANIPFDVSGMDSSIVDSLVAKMQYFDGDYKDFQFNQSGRFWKANIEFVRENMEIEDGIKLITTSSSNMGYFNKYPSLEECENCDSHSARFNGLKEISLSLSTDKGEILFVGCSHSTVEKIVEETRSHTNEEIAMVYGGYHLLPYDRPTLVQLASRLKNEHDVKKVAPAHCTGHLAFKVLLDIYGEDYVYAGLGEAVTFDN